MNRIFQYLIPYLAALAITAFLGYCLGFINGGHLSLYATTTVANLSQLAIAASFVWIIFQYTHQTNYELVSSAIEEISVFREKVIPNFENYITLIQEKHGTKFNPTRIENIEEFRLEWVRLKTPVKFDTQLKEYEDAKVENQDIERAFIEFANSMEEFAIRVKHTKTAGHEALVSTIDTFILQVEMTAVLILNYTFHSKNMYPGVKYLYKVWRKKADRRTMERKLADSKKWIDKIPRKSMKVWGQYFLSKIRTDES